MKSFFVLHILLMLYSLSGVCSKFAAKQTFFSIGFFTFYALLILILGIYAIGWQQIIKRIPLSTAFANKAVTVIWGLIWGIIIFGERITAGTIIGVLLVMCGIVLFAYSDITSNKADDINEK